MDRPNLLGTVRDYRAEIEAWMARARRSVNPPGGYYGNPSGDDLHPHTALSDALSAIEAIVKRGSVADHVRIARALGLAKGGPVADRPETCPTCGSAKRHVFIGPPCTLSPDSTYDPWHDADHAPTTYEHDGTCCTNAAGMPNCYDPARPRHATRRPPTAKYSWGQSPAILDGGAKAREALGEKT